MIAKVVVTPKPVVNDPQGLTVKQALGSLGFDDVEDVRVGKYIEVRLGAESEEAAAKSVERMCRELLANHVIEDYKFSLDSPPPAERGEVGGGPEKSKSDSPSDLPPEGEKRLVP